MNFTKNQKLIAISIFVVVIVGFFLNSVIGGTGIIVNVTPKNNLDSGLVGYWTFDGKDTNWGTGQITDKSGNNNTGKVVGMSTSTAPTIGVSGQALNFVRASSRKVVVSDASSIQLTNAVTVSMWIKPTVTGTDRKLLSKQSGAVMTGYKLSIYTNNKVEFEIRGNSTSDLNRNVSGGTTLAANTWYHVVGLFSDSDNLIATYVNGVLDRSLVTQKGLGSNNLDMWIGAGQNESYCSPNGCFFDGVIDDVRVYNRALSSNEIFELYKTGERKANMNISQKNAIAGSLVGYWTFDGKDTNWGTGQITDKSGNGNTGQMVGMSTSTAPTIGVSGQALNFDGVNDYVNAGSAASLDDVRPITISAWIKPDSYGGANEGAIVSKGDSGASGAWRLYLNQAASNFIFQAGGSSPPWRSSSVNIITLSQWQHLVITWDGGLDPTGINLYYNGSLSNDSGSIGDSLTSDASNSLYMGMRYAGGRDVPNYFDGAIDNVRIYSRVLSASEIQSLYNSGAKSLNISQ
ncbi:MAG: LamG domain-containing protein [Candidatus Pacebacteria bacterium]|nr:LamG domain-containing protein [Candidatus Paceibacterota bacterium]